MNASLLLFSTLALVTVATPGPTTLLALNHGARHGVRAALPGVGGAVLSDAVQITAVAAGLGSLLATSATAFELLRWTGVAYLAWLGWRLLRSPVTPTAAGLADAAAAATAHRKRPAAVFRRSFTVAVTNPKGYLFFSALLPSFIDPAAPLWPQYALLATVFAGIDGAALRQPPRPAPAGPHQRADAAGAGRRHGAVAAGRALNPTQASCGAPLPQCRP